VLLGDREVLAHEHNIALSALAEINHTLGDSNHPTLLARLFSVKACFATYRLASATGVRGAQPKSYGNLRYWTRDAFSSRDREELVDEHNSVVGALSEIEQVVESTEPLIDRLRKIVRILGPFFPTETLR
jgi:hypothetical protein